ncbi:MAG: hypothetical protein HWD58_10660 [Bacteroidota bacterium]|nr:MAG: hypothetical protein HWD58_10660 [Bacteroidota bacterium]
MFHNGKGLYIGTEEGAFYLDQHLRRLKQSADMARPSVMKIHALGDELIGSGRNLYQLNPQRIAYADARMAQRLQGEPLCVSTCVQDSLLCVYSRSYDDIYFLHGKTKNYSTVFTFGLMMYRISKPSIITFGCLHSRVCIGSISVPENGIP